MRYSHRLKMLRTYFLVLKKRSHLGCIYTKTMERICACLFFPKEGIYMRLITNQIYIKRFGNSKKVKTLCSKKLMKPNTEQKNGGRVGRIGFH